MNKKLQYNLLNGVDIPLPLCAANKLDDESEGYASDDENESDSEEVSSTTTKSSSRLSTYNKDFKTDNLFLHASLLKFNLSAIQPHYSDKKPWWKII
jgi:hypothetical protein